MRIWCLNDLKFIMKKYHKNKTKYFCKILTSKMIHIFVIGVLWYLQSLIFSVKNRSKNGQKYLKNGPIFGHFGTKIYRPFMEISSYAIVPRRKTLQKPDGKVVPKWSPNGPKRDPLFFIKFGLVSKVAILIG